MEKLNNNIGTVGDEQANSEGIAKTGKRAWIEWLASSCIIALAFLLPVFFVPDMSFPLQFSKSIILYIVVLVVFSLWIIARLKDGEFVIPSSTILLALGAIVGLSALSGLFSGSTMSSLLGQGFEVGTTVNILIVSVLAFLIPVMLRGKKQILGTYLAFLASFFLIAVFHVLRLIVGPDFLSAGVFNETASNTIGRWNDLGIFFGVSALLSLVTIEFLSLIRFFNPILYITLTISLFFIAVVNFEMVWFVLGIFSLIFLVYLISFRGVNLSLLKHEGLVEGAEEDVPQGTRPSRHIPVPSLTVLLISVIFILAGNTIGGQLSEVFKVSQIDIHPSWGDTFEVARHIIIKDPLLGAGPNQFVSEWLKYKPDGINNTFLWNADFRYGVGLIPTFLATTGILGILAWVIFFLIFLYSGFKAMLSNISDKLSQYLITSSFLVSLFLWIFSIFYIPSPTIFALTFIFTGLFIAALMAERMSHFKSVSFMNNPRAGFASVLLLILLLIGTVTLGYILVQKYVASVFFQKAVVVFNTEGNVAKSEELIARAASMSPTDIYYRSITELKFRHINELLSQKQDTVSAESVRTEFQNLLKIALENAEQAVSLNSGNYENFLTLGRVYETVVPLKVGRAYESAKAAYEQALILNPKSPAILLTMARLEVAKGDNLKARENISRALKEKNNYTEAIFLLSQLEAQEGNIKEAILAAEAAATIAPGDATVFFQLGLLRFNDKNYRGAIDALERAVALNGLYANAKYFLGLSYEKLDRNKEAIAQFTDLKATNPDNKEINLILRNLKAGRVPFSDATPPVDDKPERRNNLPVEDETAKASADED